MKWLLIVVALLAATIDSFGQAAQAQVRWVENIAQLRTLNVLNPQPTVSVRGYVTVGDGGQGIFEYRPGSNLPDDGGINIIPNSGGGNWVRQVGGRDFMARWWGPATTNATAQSAIDYVTSHGYGSVTLDGGTWTVKADDSTRLTLKTGVTLRTAEDSQIVCAANPTNDYTVIDIASGSRDWILGPARIVGWNLTAPGGDTNKAGVIVSAQNTHNGTIGGIRASNWYSDYANIGSGNENIQMFDQDWQPGGMAFGMKGDGLTDDRKSGQTYARFCERYNTEFFLRPTTNGYLIGGSPGSPVAGGIYFTNGVGVKIRGDKTLIKQFYYNPDEGVVSRYSTVFDITADNCSIDSFKFTTVGTFPVTETNASVTGFFIPIVVHMATNTSIRNCSFDVESGKGVFLSGTRYTTLENLNFERCGLSTGNAHQPDWLWYEAAVPIKGGPSWSTIGLTMRNCTFNRGALYKHTTLLSAANKFLVEGNHWVDLNTSIGGLIVYSGDEGTTDEQGTNVFEVSGLIKGNFFGGTNFGPDGALWVRLNTPTNFVPASFNPSNMYSAITIEQNHISGGGTNGHGIELLSAQGTRLVNNDVRTGSNPIWGVGNCNDLRFDGGYYQGTNSSVGGITIHFASGFLQPAQSRRISFHGATFVSPEGDECMFRNVEPNSYDSLTIENCDLFFNGTNGVGDYPQLFQFSLSTNWIRFVNNRIYYPDTMHNRRMGTLINTNAEIIFDDNRVVPTGTTVIKRGPYFKGKSVIARNNNVGTFELDGVIDGTLQQNIFTSQTNAFVALDVHDSGQITVQGNVIRNEHTNTTALVVSMGATNSTFKGNIVTGYTSSDIVRNNMGKMYEDDNVILNYGPGYNFVTTNGIGIVRHSMFERPVTIDSGTNGPMLTLHRVPGGGSLEIDIDDYFNTSTRDVTYHALPDVLTDIAGHAFFVNTAAGSNKFGFGYTGQQQWWVGQTNAFTEPFVFVSGGGGALGNAYMRIMSTNTTGTRDAGIVFYVPNANGNDTAGTIFFVAKQTNGTDTTFAQELVTANDGGFTKRGKWTLKTADVNGTLQTAITSDYLQNLTIAGRLALGTGGGVIAGTGNPQSAVAAPVGYIFLRTDSTGGVYNKTNGTGTTGWALVAGGSGASGDVVGPAGATDNQLALFSGVSGQLLKATSTWLDTGAGLIPTSNNAKDIGTSGAQVKSLYVGTDIVLDGLEFRTRTGTPEAAVTADTGSLILRKDGGVNSTAYFKVSGDGVNTGYYPVPLEIDIPVACSDETTALTTGLKRSIRMPGALTLTGIRANLVTAQSSGTIFTVDVQEGGVSILSTLITIDNTELTSTTAAASAVISDASIADDALVTFHITQVGAGDAAGLKVLLIGHR